MHFIWILNSCLSASPLRLNVCLLSRPPFCVLSDIPEGRRWSDEQREVSVVSSQSNQATPPSPSLSLAFSLAPCPVFRTQSGLLFLLFRFFSKQPAAPATHGAICRSADHRCRWIDCTKADTCLRVAKKKQPRHTHTHTRF